MVSRVAPAQAGRGDSSGPHKSGPHPGTLQSPALPDRRRRRSSHRVGPDRVHGDFLTATRSLVSTRPSRMLMRRVAKGARRES
jgi:hypothetical protein